MQHGDPEIAQGGTMRLLVRNDRTLGLADHIPDHAGHPLCKINLKLSGWHIEHRGKDEAKVCHRCTIVLTKLARS